MDDIPEDGDESEVVSDQTAPTKKLNTIEHEMRVQQRELEKHAKRMSKAKKPKPLTKKELEAGIEEDDAMIKRLERKLGLKKVHFISFSFQIHRLCNILDSFLHNDFRKVAMTMMIYLAWVRGSLMLTGERLSAPRTKMAVRMKEQRISKILMTIWKLTSYPKIPTI